MNIEEIKDGNILELRQDYNENNTLTYEAVTLLKETLEKYENDRTVKVLSFSYFSKVSFKRVTAS